MPPKKKLPVIDTNQRKITSMLQQGPELTQDAPTSADSESAEPDALLEWRKVKDRIIFQKTADQEN